MLKWSTDFTSVKYNEPILATVTLDEGTRDFLGVSKDDPAYYSVEVIRREKYEDGTEAYVTHNELVEPIAWAPLPVPYRPDDIAAAPEESESEEDPEAG